MGQRINRSDGLILVVVTTDGVIPIAIIMGGVVIKIVAYLHHQAIIHGVLHPMVGVITHPIIGALHGAKIHGEIPIMVMAMHGVLQQLVINQPNRHHHGIMDLVSIRLRCFVCNCS
jgi:hypothetical protein